MNTTNNKTTHTPGPWTYNPTEGEVISPNVVFTGDIGGIPEEADGYLIAAAPEMYEIIKSLRNEYVIQYQAMYRGETADILDRIDYVIAKAEGRV